MQVMLFGATGMVGRGVLREGLLAPDVELDRARASRLRLEARNINALAEKR